MPAYDYVCKNNHLVEINCGRNELKEIIVCPECGEKAARSFKGMSIKSNVKYGTGGGRDMKQS